MSDTLHDGPSREEMLQEVANARVKSVEWFDDREHELQITLPFGCKYGGGITTSNEQKVFNGSLLRVNPQLRGNKIGSRLVKATLARAKELGATRFETGVESQFALDIFAGIFGDNLHVSSYDPVPGSPRYTRTDLPAITIDQVRASLERLEAHEDNLESRQEGFFLEADLSALDTTGWELPAVELPE